MTTRRRKTLMRQIIKSGIVEAINNLVPINWANEFKQATCDVCGRLPIAVIETETGKALCEEHK